MTQSQAHHLRWRIHRLRERYGLPTKASIPGTPLAALQEIEEAVNRGPSRLSYLDYDRQFRHSEAELERMFPR